MRAKVEASAAIRSSFATAFRVSGFVSDFRWSAISWRSRWISLMLSFMCALFRGGSRSLSQPWRGWMRPRPSATTFTVKATRGLPLRGVSKERDEIRAEVHAIQKHLGIEGKIAA